MASHIFIKYEVVDLSNISPYKIGYILEKKHQADWELFCIDSDKAYFRHKRKVRYWKLWQCKLMSILDFRYWQCECHYTVPFGKVIMAGCEKHD